MKGFGGLLVLLLVLCVVYAGYKALGPEKKPVVIEPEKPAPSQLVVVCDPGVSVLLEGKAVGFYDTNKAGWVVNDLTAGQHRMEAVLPDCATQSCWVALLPGSTLSLTLDPFVPLKTEEVKGSETDDTLLDRSQEEELIAENSRVIDLGGGVQMELVWCPPGSFMMGPGEGMATEQPQHEVVLSKGFWMGRYEVTQAQYRSLVEAAPSHFVDGKNPVERVNWQAAVTFCDALSRKAGVVCRLPTEAQWEYACRAGASSDNEAVLDAVAWYNLNSQKKTHPVGLKSANAWGLFDMQGNVAEWCSDWVGDYSSEKVTDPTGPKKGSNKVQRGGGWNSPANYCSTTFRYGSSPICSNYYLGFRVIVTEE